MAPIGLVLSLWFFHELQGVREGTVLSALIVGQFVKVYGTLFPHGTGRLFPH